MIEQLTVQRVLTEHLVEAKIKNPSYSLRAFARRLSISSGALSTVLNGKRRISRRMAVRISDKLCLNPKQKRDILNSFSQRALSDPALQIHYTQLNLDQFNMISEWYHFALLSLIQTKDFRNNAKWIAKRLNIRLKEARAALKRLQRLGLIDCDSKGSLYCKGPNYTTSDDVLNPSLRKSHVQNLELARESLEQDEIEKRDFSAMTMAINPNKLQEAKLKIRSFLDEMSLLLETDPKSEVYKLCIQFIPLTRGEEK